MVVDQDHYITKIYDRPGVHLLTAEEFGTEWVAIAVRTLVDPADPADLDRGGRPAGPAGRDRPVGPGLHSGLGSGQPGGHPPAMLELARGRASMTGAFGSRRRRPDRALAGHFTGRWKAANIDFSRGSADWRNCSIWSKDFYRRFMSCRGAETCP